VYRPRRKPSPAFATRIMGRRLATRADITLRGTLAAISSLAFSLACSVSLCGPQSHNRVVCRCNHAARAARGPGLREGPHGDVAERHIAGTREPAA